MPRIFKSLSVIVILVLLLSAVGVVTAAATNADKVTICHRTNSTTNPYVQITVDRASVDGDLSNDNGRGDHFAEHVGPVWSSGMPNGGDWGDIIPPINGVHNGLNWDSGQAIYNNGCEPTDNPPNPQDASAGVNSEPGCVDANETKTVTVTVSHATLTIAGQSFTANGSLQLGPGSYPWSATPDEGYTMTGSSSGTVNISQCPPEPEEGKASVTIGECKVDPVTGEALAEVIVKVNHATVHINDQDISEDTTLWLPQGDYAYTWQATEGYVGSGEGTLKVTPDCKPVYHRKFVCLFAPCGPHQEEWAKQPDDVVVVHYAYGDCRCVRGGKHVWDDLRMYMRSIHPFSILISNSEKAVVAENVEIDAWNARADTGTYNGVHQQHLAYHVDTNSYGVKLVYLDAQAFVGVDGVTYYILDASKSLVGSGNWPIYNPETKNLYAMDYGLKSVTESVYIACSRSYGPWDIRADGVAIRPMGVTSWEVTWWLWNNGYAPHTWQGWLQIDKWTDAMWLLGQAQLPSK